MLNNARLTQLDRAIIEAMRFVLAVALVTVAFIVLIFLVPYAALQALRIMIKIAVVTFCMFRRLYAALSYGGLQYEL